MIFDIENLLWKSDFGTFWKGCKAKQKDPYNQSRWLSLLDLLNEWVAEGVAFDPHDFARNEAVQGGLHLFYSLNLSFPQH